MWELFQLELCWIMDFLCGPLWENPQRWASSSKAQGASPEMGRVAVIATLTLLLRYKSLLWLAWWPCLNTQCSSTLPSPVVPGTGPHNSETSSVSASQHPSPAHAVPGQGEISLFFIPGVLLPGTYSDPYSDSVRFCGCENTPNSHLLAQSAPSMSLPQLWPNTQEPEIRVIVSENRGISWHHSRKIFHK